MVQFSIGDAVCNFVMQLQLVMQLAILLMMQLAIVDVGFNY